MNFLQQALQYIFSAENWAGPAGLGARILEHRTTGTARLDEADCPLGLLGGMQTFLSVRRRERCVHLGEVAGRDVETG
jgi:hypothetical protein